MSRVKSRFCYSGQLFQQAQENFEKLTWGNFCRSRIIRWLLRNIRKNCLADGLSDDFLNRLAFSNDKIDLKNEAGLKQDLRENDSRQAWSKKESFFI